MNRMKNRKWCFVFFPLLGIAFLALVGLIVMLLWNYTLPDIFHFPVITFWQALGLFLLAKVLFGFGKGKGGPPWANRAKHRAFAKLSEEEKEKFRSYMQSRKCDWEQMRSRFGQAEKEEGKQEDQSI